MTLDFITGPFPGSFFCKYEMPMGGGKEGVAPPEYRQLHIILLNTSNPTK